MKAVLLVARIACCSALLALSAQATDLGSIGPALPIHEQDMAEMLRERMRRFQESGELDKKHTELKQHARSYAARPPGVSLPRATANSGHFYNPSLRVSEDILDADGNVLIKAGQVVNPYAVRPLQKGICLIDGDDVRQVAWLQSYCGDKHKFIAILVNGSIGELRKQLDFPVFFDQRHEWVRKFDIKAVPTVIRQTGTMFYVETFEP